MHREPLFSVKGCGYDDLSDDQKDNVPNNGIGKKDSNYIVIEHNDDKVIVHSDAMEPEDAVFFRDLSWIQDALMRCYLLGKQDALDGL